MMGHMYGFGNWMIWGWIIFIIITIVSITFIFWFLDTIRNMFSKNSQDKNNESALDILKKRYARGEIEYDEFIKKKKDLEN